MFFLAGLCSMVLSLLALLLIRPCLNLYRRFRRRSTNIDAPIYTRDVGEKDENEEWEMQVPNRITDGDRDGWPLIPKKSLSS